MPVLKKNPPAKLEDLLRQIKRRFPDIEWQSAVLKTIGWDHDVVILDDNFVFRFPNDTHYKILLKVEIEILDHLIPCTLISIPNYTRIAPDYSFAGYPMIRGKTLNRSLLKTFLPEQRTIVAKQLAETLTTIHTLVRQTDRFAHLPSSWLPEDQKEVKKMAQKHLTRELTKKEMQKVSKILYRIDTHLKIPSKPTLIHGDIYSQHVLWDKASQALGLIDFSEVSYGDPAMDFSGLFDYGDDFVKEIYRYYKAAKDDLFLTRALDYRRWNSIYMMTDHFTHPKTSFAVARQEFDLVK